MGWKTAYTFGKDMEGSFTVSAGESLLIRLHCWCLLLLPMQRYLLKSCLLSSEGTSQ